MRALEEYIFDMSDSTGAAGIVRNKFETAQSYANDAWTSALTFLDNLGSVAKLVYPDVGLPDLPGTPTYPAAPTAPDLTAVTPATLSGPTVPELTAADLDGIDIPDFTVTPPDIVLPDPPDMSGYAIRNDGVYGCRAVAAASDCAGNEVFSRVWLAAAPPLAHIKAEACSRIDATAEALCTNRLTPGITQQTRYARKLAQAEAFLQNGTPTEAEYPLIYNEVGITARSAGAVAMTCFYPIAVRIRLGSPYGNFLGCHHFRATVALSAPSGLPDPGRSGRALRRLLAARQQDRTRGGLSVPGRGGRPGRGLAPSAGRTVPVPGRVLRRGHHSGRGVGHGPYPCGTT